MSSRAHYEALLNPANLQVEICNLIRQKILKQTATPIELGSLNNSSNFV